MLREWGPSDPRFNTVPADPRGEWAFLLQLDGSRAINETLTFRSSAEDRYFIFHTFLFPVHDAFLAEFLSHSRKHWQVADLEVSAGKHEIALISPKAHTLEEKLYPRLIRVALNEEITERIKTLHPFLLASLSGASRVPGLSINHCLCSQSDSSINSPSLPGCFPSPAHKNSQVLLELSGITGMQEKYMVTLNESYCWRPAEKRFPDAWGLRSGLTITRASLASKLTSILRAEG